MLGMGTPKYRVMYSTKGINVYDVAGFTICKIMTQDSNLETPAGLTQA
jgi:hypothetical protein